MKEYRTIGSATVNQNGGVSLPASIRREKRLRAGDKVVWLEVDDYIVIVGESEYRQMLSATATTNPSALVEHHLEMMGLNETEDPPVRNMKEEKSKRGSNHSS